MGNYRGRTLLITYTFSIILSQFSVFFFVFFYKTSYILKKKCIHLKINAYNKDIITFWSEYLFFHFSGGWILHLYVMSVPFTHVCFCLIAEDNLIAVI